MSLHPSVAAVRRGVRRALVPLSSGQTVLVACSGGPDSLALLAATVFEAHKVGLRVVGVTVDHGLQSGSEAQAARTVEQMALLGADETATAKVTVNDPTGLGPEAAARRARYAALDQATRHFGASVVLLGHTRDDQAETVLLGLARGSGGRSLAGMRRAFESYRRPLLDVPRADTVTACQVEGIDFWDDPHNHDPGYARVRVRERILPALEDQLGPGVAASLARTADQLRADTELLDQIAEQRLYELRPYGDRGPLPVEVLAEEPVAIRRRLLRLAALAAGAPAAELLHEHIVALDSLITDWHGQKWVDLPGHLHGVRRENGLSIEPAQL